MRTDNMGTAPMTDATLYSRSEHGGHPVRVLGEGAALSYEVAWPDGSVTYPSARQLIRALYNAGDIGEGTRDPGMSFNRYFRLGRFSKIQSDGGVLSALGVEDPREAVAVQGPVGRRGPRVRSPRVSDLSSDLLFMLGWDGVVRSGGSWSVSRALRPRSVRPGSRGPVKGRKRAQKALRGSKSRFTKGSTPVISPQGLNSDGTGIDLAARGHEVRKLLFAGFGRRMARASYDPEDVLQEVYKGLLVRNRGKCPFDARKSSFGHYVHMVCECVLSNYHRKQARRGEFEQIGVLGLTDTGEWGSLDAGQLASDLTSDPRLVAGGTGLGRPDEAIGMERAVRSFGGMLEDDKPDAVMASRVLPYVLEGYQRGEIARELSLEPSRVGRALAYLRKQGRVWREAQGL